ncbi:MAG TPA: hypothetical protein VFB76_12245 [Candidatus Angelobacter sp.]|nr:hypothetical protein [Candidatus Angelobacter sp.]
MKKLVIAPTTSTQNDSATNASGELHPAWQALIRFCREVGYGEIELIKIQDGLPVSAEVIRKKIRWC